MSWFRVDDKFHSHRKRMRSNLEATGLWCIAGSYCMDHLTDGVVPREWVEEVAGDAAGELAARLVAAGLWAEHPDGWAFHDWGTMQPSRRELLELKKERGLARSEAGAKGGVRSGEARRSKREANGKQTGSKREASGNESGTNREAKAKQNEAPSHPIPERERTPLGAPPEAADQGRGSGVFVARAKALTATPAPDDIDVSAELVAACVMAGWADPREHVATFLANARAKGSMFVDWGEALKTWCARQKRFDAASKTRSSPVVQPDDPYLGWDASGTHEVPARPLAASLTRPAPEHGPPDPGNVLVPARALRRGLAR